MLEIFQYDFMIRAFVAGTIIAIIAPLIGTFLVVRRLSMLAETLAHVALLGVAIGLLTGIQPVLAATLTAVLVAVAIEKVRHSKKIFGESVLALFLSGSLALSSVLLSLAGGFNQNLFSFLFGSITTVTAVDLSYIIALALITIIITRFTYKELFLVSFDDELADLSGINARAFNLLLVILAAVTVALSMRIVGVLLIGALMVIPVLTAMNLARSFRQIIAYAILTALIAVLSGLFLSYYLNLASGGTIVLTALVLFLASLLFRKN